MDKRIYMVMGVVLAALILSLAPVAWAYQTPEGSQYYPCIQCHANFKPAATTNMSTFHNITLEGAHSGLYCVNCHNPDSAMMELNGGVPLRIPGIHNHTQLFDTNKLCAQCHADIYELYLVGAHGNTTFTCPGGETHIVIGYKGVKYLYHDCPPGAEYETVPQQPCIACHNPHSPKFKPPSVLPPASDRPEPPPQQEITLGGISTFITGLSLIGLAVLVHKKGKG